MPHRLGGRRAARPPERLDAFEGPGYRRVAVEVETAEGTVQAWLYAAAQPSDG
jgi:gamma-glutamylcyclotransferase (GGCT)/AIG2-like uncharacterized protein YtfP